MDAKTFVRNIPLYALVKYRKVNPISLSKNYLIFGSPRSGTTWLMQMLQQTLSAQVIWEPLNPRLQTIRFKNLHLGWSPYLDPIDQHDGVVTVFKSLFSGQENRSVLFSESGWFNLLLTSSQLIKFCRGHLLLPWLVMNFRFTNKPIFIIRNPYAVVSSQLLHSGWNHLIKNLPITKFDSPIFSQYNSYLSSLNNLDEYLTAVWCINNMYVINNSFNNTGWTTLLYEGLLENTTEEILRIVETWNLEFDVRSIATQKRSFTVIPKISTDSDRFNKWKNKLSSSQIDRITKVLEFFQIEKNDLIKHYII